MLFLYERLKYDGKYLNTDGIEFDVISLTYMI